MRKPLAFWSPEPIGARAPRRLGALALCLVSCASIRPRATKGEEPAQPRYVLALDADLFRSGDLERFAAKLSAPEQPPDARVDWVRSGGEASTGSWSRRSRSARAAS